MATKEQIEKRSADSEKAKINRRLLRALRAGEDAMRQQSVTDNLLNSSVYTINDKDVLMYKKKPFLLREKNEKDENFWARLLYKTSLFSGTKKTINDISDRIFAKSIVFEHYNENFTKHILTNFDGCGSGLTEVAERIHKDGSWNGCSFIVVNQPTTQRYEENSFPTVVVVDPNDVLQLEIGENNRTELFKYTYTYQRVVDIFNIEEVTVVDYYYYNKNNQTVLRRYEKVNDEDYIEVIKDKILPIKEIPVVEYYPETDKKGLDCDLPFQDIADKNLTHWIFNSVYISLVDYSSRSFIFGKGFEPNKTNKDKDGNIVLEYGMHNVYINKSTNAEMKWVQADSKSSDMIRTFLIDLKDEMKMLGSEFLETKAFMSATEVKYQTADSNNRASKFAINLEKALDKIIRIMLEWQKMDVEDFTLEVNKNIGLTKDDEIFDKATQLHDKLVISDKHYREISKMTGYLSNDKTEEEILEELEKEGKLFGSNNIMLLEDEENKEVVEQEEEEENLEE